MNRAIYTDIQTPDLQTFYFNSVGTKGVIPKVVVYSKIRNLDNSYNLGFGTVKLDLNGNEYIDGEDRTNNGDTHKVLSTVAKTVEIYTSVYPDRKIYFTGYIPELTKLYQRAIRTDYNLIEEEFSVFGDLDNQLDNYRFESFNPSKEYFGFLLQKK